ncbi:hypothetical protein pEaSNUABM29_00115 [Erwinia phage pEa_SNUABM_29]|nr:hypothetical protein pEaSNUABM29_00115 [Erwinia phage pEa_SNUABM_29]
MTHKVSLNNLVLDFKRTNEGKGVEAQRALTGLVAYALAFNAVLPDNGIRGGAEAASTFLRPIMRSIVSDVNELYCVDLGVVEDMTVGLYVNRYCNVFGGERAMQSFSVREIFDQALGADVWETVGLWIGRFMETFGFYMAEVKGQIS